MPRLSMGMGFGPFRITQPIRFSGRRSRPGSCDEPTVEPEVREPREVRAARRRLAQRRDTCACGRSVRSTSCPRCGKASVTDELNAAWARLAAYQDGQN